MRGYYVRRAIALSALLALAACEGMAGGSRVQSAAVVAFPPKPEDCTIVIYRSGRPGGAYTVVARLTARVDGPPAPGGDLDSVLGEMKKQACYAGADALANLAVRRDPNIPLAIVSADAVRFAPPQ